MGRWVFPWRGTIGPVALLMGLALLAMTFSSGCSKDNASNTGNVSQDGAYGDSADGLDDVSGAGSEDQTPSEMPTGSEDAVSDLDGPSDAGDDTSVAPDLATVDVQPSVDLFSPDTNSSTSLGPLGKACVQLLQGFCDKLLAKCDQLPVVGKLITPTVISNCDSLVNASPEAQELVCAQADSANPPASLAPLVQFGPALVQTCLGGFQCTSDTAIAIAKDLVPIVTDLAQGTSPDMLQVAGVALKLCLP